MAKPRENESQRRLWLGDKPSRQVKTNVVYQGDNLPILKELESNKIDLCYIDPPFCSQSVQTSKAWGKKVVSFNDEWGGGVQSYMHWLSPRLKEMHRLLSPTGVFCLHLDRKAVHYAKIELDKIFGEKNLINEIVWQRYSGQKNNLTKKFSSDADYILIYSKTKDYIFNLIKKDDLDPDYIEKEYKYQFYNGKFRLLTEDQLKGKEKIYGERCRSNRRSKNSKQGGGNPYSFLKNSKGKTHNNIWTDIPELSNMKGKNTEATGWPTQKPLSLLSRLIQAFTNKGDMVFDGFCGCGTTISSAQNLGRLWLGCDISKDAIKVIRHRMAKEHGLKIKVIPTGSLSKDNILSLDPFEFERYVVGLIGQPNVKQRGDGGVDGYTYNHIPIQVKKSYKVGRPVLDSFYKHIEKRGAGILIAHSFCPTLIEEKNRIENEKGWHIDLIETRDLLRDAA